MINIFADFIEKINGKERDIFLSVNNLALEVSDD